MRGEKKPKKREHFSRVLFIAEAARMLGMLTPEKDVNFRTREVVTKRLAYHLRCASVQVGEPLVFGGGSRNKKLYTTVACLRKAGFIDEIAEMADEAREAIEERDERIAALESRVQRLAQALTSLTADYAAFKARFRRA